MLVSAAQPQAAVLGCCNVTVSQVEASPLGAAVGTAPSLGAPRLNASIIGLSGAVANSACLAKPVWKWQTHTTCPGIPLVPPQVCGSLCVTQGDFAAVHLADSFLSPSRI